MGSYLSGATTGPRQPRRLATSAIGLVAVIGLVTACTASSVGAAKRAPDRYPAGATVQVQAQAETTATAAADSPQALRIEQQDPVAHDQRSPSSGTPSEYQLTRSEHQRATHSRRVRGATPPAPGPPHRPDDRRRPSSEPGELAGGRRRRVSRG